MGIKKLYELLREIEESAMKEIESKAMKEINVIEVRMMRQMGLKVLPEMREKGIATVPPEVQAILDLEKKALEAPEVKAWMGAETKAIYERVNVEKQKSQIFFNVPVTRFAGKRLAIDTNILMNKDLAIATRNVVNRTNLAVADPDRAAIIKEWIIICLRKVLSFLIRDITPILVFDGPPRPEKKLKQDKKHQERLEKEKKIADLTNKVRSSNNPNPGDVKELANQWQYNFRVTKEESGLLYNVFSSLGLPCMKAKHDGEELCSVLALEGFCEAVWSIDQDCMAWGAPLAVIDQKIVPNPEGGAADCYVVVDLQHTLNVLGLSFDEFQDLCIFAGCDFNNNIPGFAIKKAYPFYKKNKGGTRGLFEKHKEKTKCLNYEECKRVFRLKVWEEVCTTELKLSVSPEIGRKFGRKVLEPYDKDMPDLPQAGGVKGMDAFYESIMGYFQRLTPPQISKCRNPIKCNVVSG